MLRKYNAYLYDAKGQLIAEHSTQLSQQPQTSYLTSDHLGSPRINTNALGQVISRHDYQPFGEEIARSVYGADTNRKQFTGYERDKETDLDFAQARYHNFNLGRFNSPDPVLIDDNRLADPQGINRYIYVRNNPLKYTDPDGRVYVGIDGKKVKVKYLKDKNGKIIGIKNVGKNATPELQEIVSLIQKLNSGEALSDFIKGDKSITRINVKLVKDFTSHMAPHKGDKLIDFDSEESPDYVRDPETGEWAYREITIFLNYVEIPELLSYLENVNSVSNLTSDEYRLASFGHELEHGLDADYIKRQRGTFFNKTLDKRQRADFLRENYLINEKKAKERTKKILEDIKKQSNNLDNKLQWK